jgi:glycosyltransferase involved in cell wall biosynthesis
MKILYLCFDSGIDLSGVKGASIHVRSFVRALTELGHEVAVVGTNVSSLASFETLTGATVLRAPLSPRSQALLRALKARKSLALGLSSGRDLVRAFHNSEFLRVAEECTERLSPNFIYERYSLWGTAGQRLARNHSIPLVLEVNSPLTQEEQKYRGWSLFHAFARWAERCIWRRADMLVAVSRVLCSHFEEAGVKGRKIEILPNAVDTRLFHPEVDDSALRTRLKPCGRFVVGFVGSFKVWHGVDFLLEAFTRLRKEDASYHLLLVGDGPRRAELEERTQRLGLQEAVTLVGNVPHEEVSRYLALMDIAVAPYPAVDDFYFSPLKLYEYMACSRAVIASRIGQVAEVITDGFTGLLYEPGNQEALIACILRLRADESLRRELGQNARMACSKNTWRRNAEQVVRWVEPLLQHAATSLVRNTGFANGGPLVP